MESNGEHKIKIKSINYWSTIFFLKISTASINDLIFVPLHESCLTLSYYL